MLAHRQKQRGVALLAFTVVLAIVAFTIVMGYSVSTAKKQAASLEVNQTTYLNDVRQKLAAAYAANARTIDSDDPAAGAPWTSVQAPDLLAWAGITPRWGLQVAITPPISRDNVKYRVIAAWLPLDSDAPETPVLANDGTFTPCPSHSVDCVSRVKYAVMTEGLTIQRNNAKKAQQQLEAMAANAQAFFKAKMMADPEHNASVNYFRPPYGGCDAAVEQMPCVDSPQALWSPLVQQRNTSQSMAELLGLPDAPVLNPWGISVEVCNGGSCGDPFTDASTGQTYDSHVVFDPLETRTTRLKGPPYTMLFQTRTPWGTAQKVYAVQQL
jgi:type II secretory pathway pseudopilin PulG